jgi:hypothetical protein
MIISYRPVTVFGDIWGSVFYKSVLKKCYFVVTFEESFKGPRLCLVESRSREWKGREKEKSAVRGGHFASTHKMAADALHFAVDSCAPWHTEYNQLRPLCYLIYIQQTSSPQDAETREQTFSLFCLPEGIHLNNCMRCWINNTVSRIARAVSSSHCNVPWMPEGK